MNHGVLPCAVEEIANGVERLRVDVIADSDLMRYGAGGEYLEYLRRSALQQIARELEHRVPMTVVGRVPQRSGTTHRVELIPLSPADLRVLLARAYQAGRDGRV